MDEILRVHRFHLAYARRLVADVPDEKMAAAGGVGLENHPTFTLGHLVMAAARTGAMLGLPLDVPAGWAELFDRTGPGDPRIPAEGGAHPTKDALLAELARQHERVAGALAAATPEVLDAAVDWRFGGWMPSVRDAVAFMLTTHAASHLGQLAAWRRALGFPSALGSLERGPDG